MANVASVVAAELTYHNALAKCTGVTGNEPTNFAKAK
jgi:hypothetical protein